MQIVVKTLYALPVTARVTTINTAAAYAVAPEFHLAARRAVAVR